MPRKRRPGCRGPSGRPHQRTWPLRTSGAWRAFSGGRGRTGYPSSRGARGRACPAATRDPTSSSRSAGRPSRGSRCSGTGPEGRRASGRESAPPVSRRTAPRGSAPASSPFSPPRAGGVRWEAWWPTTRRARGVSATAPCTPGSRLSRATSPGASRSARDRTEAGLSPSTASTRPSRHPSRMAGGLPPEDGPRSGRTPPGMR